MNAIAYRPIGVIRSCHQRPEQTPIQPVYASDCDGRAELRPEFAEGLRDLDGYSHVHLIYHFDRSPGPKMLVKPFLEDVERGVFSTRSSARPNPVGLSLVRLVRIEGSTLILQDVDVLDGTPLLDVKPYVPRFDSRPDARGGWNDQVDEATAQRRGRRDFSGRQGDDA